MRARSKTPKLGQIGIYWLSKRSDHKGPNDAWHITWYDERGRQTRRTNLGTADFQEASLALAEWVVENDRPDSKIQPNKVLINTVITNYWNEHAKNLPSARTAWNGLRYWGEFWGDRTVSEITPQEQKRFREFLFKRNIRESGIDRVLADGRAALNRAVKWQELSRAPYIFELQTAEDKRFREPLGRPIVPMEMALLFDAANSRHMLTYLVIATNTLARPGAILDLRGVQYDETHDRLNLNPPGRRQTKKHRPILAVTPTLKPWLQIVADPKHRYVAYGRKPIKSITTAWQLLIKETRLDDRVTPYSIRHGMAREMRKRKVPTDQISLFLGHLPKNSDAITAIYAPYDPEYCSEAIAAIEAVMAEIRTHLKRANIDQPMIDAAALAKAISSKTRRGVGNAKREEVRFLILSGLPHAEVVKRSRVSSGTVSSIRKEMREVIPLYRNSERDSCVPFACLESESSSLHDTQPIECPFGQMGSKTGVHPWTESVKRVTGPL